MGKIVRYELSNGKSFRAYIPDNATNDTPVFYYSYVVGSNISTDKLWQGYEQNMLEQNPNSIVIIPEDTQLVVGTSNPASHLYQNDAMEAISIIEKDLNIKTSQFTNGGFSAGFGFSVRTLAHYLEENPNAERQALIAVDGVMNDTTNIQTSELEALKENNTIILSYTQQKNHQYQARKLESTGLPILYVVDPTVPENTPDNLYWGIHDYMTKNFFSSGLYEDLINFINGKGELPKEFSYRYYDPKTGKIIALDASNASEILGITPYEIPTINSLEDIASLKDFTIRSSNETFEKHLNNIKDSIVSSNILSASSNLSFNSTTKVPSGIPSITENFFSTTTSLLTKLSKDILEFSNISVKYKEVDKELDNIANNINDKTDIDKNIEQSKEIYSNEDKIKDTTENNPTNWVNINQYSGNNAGDYVNNITYIPTDNIDNKQETIIKGTDRENYFPKYDELYSDDSKVVLEYTEDKTSHKVIIHIEKDKIIGIDHYYDYQTSKKAELAKSLILQEYVGNQHIEQLIQKDQYIKISFKEEMFSNLTITELKEQYYSKYKELIKNTEV